LDGRGLSRGDEPDEPTPEVPEGGVKDQPDGVHLAKAVKSDRMPVRVKDWNFFLALGLSEKVKARKWVDAAENIRRVAIKWCRRNQLRKCLAYRRYKLITGEFTEFDQGAITDAITRINATTWWEWKNGSRPFYWAWDKDKQIPMRDGIHLWIREKMIPSWIRPQEAPKDPAILRLVVDKLMIAREKGYISMGDVKLLIFYFDVPKGMDDIRMVYDGTKSGLNAALCPPWSPLRNVELLLRSVVPGTFMSNNDVGEMFLNFVLHSLIQERCGVDLTKFFPVGSGCALQPPSGLEGKMGVMDQVRDGTVYVAISGGPGNDVGDGSYFWGSE
jgi:hypothetical protein